MELEAWLGGLDGGGVEMGAISLETGEEKEPVIPERLYQTKVR